MADTRPNKLTQDDKNLILTLHANGIPKYKIAARLNVAPNTVNRIIRLATQRQQAQVQER